MNQLEIRETILLLLLQLLAVIINALSGMTLMKMRRAAALLCEGGRMTSEVND